MQRRFVFLTVVILGFLAISANLHAEDATEHLKNAKAWADKREHEKAIAECDQALVLDPKLAEAFNTRGWVWDDMGKHEKAIADYNRALALDPKLDKAYSNRADAWTSLGEYDKAISDCNEAIRLNPKNATAYCARGIAYGLKGEHDKAIADSTEAIHLDPKCATAYCERGLAYGSKGETDKSIAEFNRAVAIAPDNWNMFNQFGVSLWKQAQEQDLKGAIAAARGDTATANACHQKSIALKNEAKSTWIRGVAVNPKATDMHCNLGYAYSEANDLDSAEHHLTEAVRLKPTSARANNNLGRVLLRRSRQCEKEAREADAQGKTDSVKAATAKQLKEESQAKLKAAIERFEKAVELDPTLLEARLNLGEVYIQQSGVDTAKKGVDLAEKDLDKAEAEYREILKFHSENVSDRETINNFSQAYYGLARIALARKKPDAAIGFLRHAIALNDHNATVMQALARELFLRGEFGEGERALACLLAMMPKVQRPILAKQFGEQLETDGNHKEAVAAWNFLAWTFATSPDPNILDPASAMAVADRVVERTKQQNPLSLDALAAAQAASGHYEQAVKTAQTAIELSNAQHNKLLAEAIARRVPVYQQEKPYRSDPTGNDRP